MSFLGPEILRVFCWFVLLYHVAYVHLFAPLVFWWPGAVGQWSYGCSKTLPPKMSRYEEEQREDVRWMAFIPWMLPADGGVQPKELLWQHMGCIADTSKTNILSWKPKDKLIGGPHFPRSAGKEVPLAMTFKPFFIIVYPTGNWPNHTKSRLLCDSFAILPTGEWVGSSWLQPLLESWGAKKIRVSQPHDSCDLLFVDPWSTGYSMLLSGNQPWQLEIYEENGGFNRKMT